MKKIGIIVALLVFATQSSLVSAHVSVAPKTVGLASFQTFTVSVPSEKELDTIAVRLVLPLGLESIHPTVKPGWRVELVEGDENEEGEHSIAEIIWRGGSIPEHFRDEFTFSAKVPAMAGTMYWRAYQTYADGSVISWELLPDDPQPQTSEGSNDYSEFGPASQTQVFDDLTAQDKPFTDMSFAISVVALLIALASFAVAMKR